MPRNLKRKLLDAAPTFDEWFATYMAFQPEFEKASEKMRTKMYDLARAAFFRGYINATHNTIKIYDKKQCGHD